MAAIKTEFSEFVASDIKKYEGVRIPLKTSLFMRIFKRWTKCRNLHPNPDDEFCLPNVGPSYSIISDYEKRMKYAMERGDGPWDITDERIMVERMYPEGYMIINGHHRWAAALRLGIKRVPIKILNLTHDDDIINIIERSENNKRAAIDLDDLIFVNEAEYPAEKKLPYLADLRYNKKRIRLGFPALCRFLQSRGYDVWVFTSEFCSVDHIERLLKRYHITPDGIITASGRIEKTEENKKKRIREMMNKKYIRTITLYNDLMIVVNSQTGDSDQIPLEGLANEWVMDIEKAVKGLEENKG